MNIIFFGSDDFAEVHLRALIESDHEVVACVTQPDKARGRGMKVIFSPIKECALEYNIPVFQPTSLKDISFQSELKRLEADLFVVIAYGRLLPPDVLEIPKYYAINVHGSLLPKYRGAAPINWAIINGDYITGLSIIKLNPKMDAGDILVQKQIELDKEDTSATLRAKMVQVGPKVLLDTITAISQAGADSFTPIVQAPEEVTYAPKLNKYMGKIDWKKSAQEIHNLVRGLLPWPTAYTMYNKKNLKILSTQVVESKGDPGQVLDVTKEGFTVATGEQAVLVKYVHLESAKAMDADSFIRGHKLEVGFQFPIS